MEKVLKEYKMTASITVEKKFVDRKGKDSKPYEQTSKEFYSADAYTKEDARSQFNFYLQSRVQDELYDKIEVNHIGEYEITINPTLLQSQLIK
jgi:hypothetical protein